ncbi:hypothetical protein PG989_010514 [Apiospora arundinis]
MVRSSANPSAQTHDSRARERPTFKHPSFSVADSDSSPETAGRRYGEWLQSLRHSSARVTSDGLPKSLDDEKSVKNEDSVKDEEASNDEEFLAPIHTSHKRPRSDHHASRPPKAARTLPKTSPPGNDSISSRLRSSSTKSRENSSPQIKEEHTNHHKTRAAARKKSVPRAGLAYKVGSSVAARRLAEQNLEHEVISISSDSEPEDDVSSPATTTNALALSSCPAPQPVVKRSSPLGHVTDENMFHDALFVEDWLLLNSLYLPFDASDDAVIPRHFQNSRLRKAVQQMRKLRMEEWRAVKECNKANGNDRDRYAARAIKASRRVDDSIGPLAHLVDCRVRGMTNDGLQPGLSGNDWQEVHQFSRFLHVSQLRVSRPSIQSPFAPSTGILGLERVGYTPVPVPTTQGVILPGALFPRGVLPNAGVWGYSSSSNTPIESGRVAILLCNSPSPAPPQAGNSISGVVAGSQHRPTLLGGIASKVESWLENSVGDDAQANRVEEIKDEED